MRLLLAILLVAAMLPAQAQTVNICDRTPQVRNAILEWIDARDDDIWVERCTSASSYWMGRIGALNVSNENVWRLKAGDFGGLTSLERLYLNDNYLATLPAGLFDGLDSLKILDLRNNHLVGLTSDDPLFARLSNVEIRLGGQTEPPEPANICDRTPQVRDAIMSSLGADDCAAVALAALGRFLSVSRQQLTALRAGDFDGLTSLETLSLGDNRLTTLPAGVFDGLTSLGTLSLDGNQLTTLPAGVFDGLTSLKTLSLNDNRLTTLPAGVFDGLTSLWDLRLYDNQLTALPAGAFDGLTSLRYLRLDGNQLTTLPAGVFDGLTSLGTLSLNDNRLTTLPAGVFDGLTSLRYLRLDGNQLTTLPAGVFDGLTSLWNLYLNDNQLATLPTGVFDGLTRLYDLYLNDNQLTTLPAGVFDGLTRLRELYLNDNQLATLPAGVFDGVFHGRTTRTQLLDLRNNHLVGLTSDDPLFARLPSNVEIRLDGQTDPPEPAQTVNICDRTPQVRDAILEAVGAGDCAAVDPDALAALESLDLSSRGLTALRGGDFDGLTGLSTLALNDNRLTALPAGVFDGLTSLRELDLRNNHLVGLTSDGPLFAGLSSEVVVSLAGQTEPEPVRLAAAVPLMPSTFDSRQGFVRIVNESEDSGSVRVFAFDDSGHAPDPIDIPLGAGQVVHFNTNDLENGNAGKGIEGGVGGPVQGNWRLDIETTLAVRVLAFVRTTDGFFTAMHDVLPRDGDGQLVAQTFNPGSNMDQASSLRLVNTGAEDESVSIVGVDDQGNDAGPVTLTLPVGESRTLSAFDLEYGAFELTGWLGDGAGKWRLFITAGESVVGMSLLEAASGHLTNISTAGVATNE